MAPLNQWKKKSFNSQFYTQCKYSFTCKGKIKTFFRGKKEQWVAPLPSDPLQAEGKLYPMGISIFPKEWVVPENQLFKAKNNNSVLLGLYHM